MTDKLLTMRAAVAGLVPDGARVACGLALEAAWVGNVTTGSGYCSRRAVEAGQPRPLTVREHSNLTISLALQAAAAGVGYLPTRTALGSDIATDHDGFQPVVCPFTGQRLLAVRAVRPDVAVVHVQRADRRGNAQAWGNLGISQEAIAAAGTVIVVAEELVDTEVIRSRPELTLVPGALVTSVVHEPGGSHPAPLQGFRPHDADAYRDYARASATPEGFQAWLDRWVLGVADRAGYLEALGASGAGGRG